jgi:uncharacterized OB-fold protein
VTGLPTAGRLRPQPTDDTAFFWDAAAAGRLELQRCQDCLAPRFPPGPACPDCRSLRWETVVASGRGRLFSYTIVHHPPVPGFGAPAVVGVVELDEGVRLVTNLDLGPADTPVIGEPLEVFFLPQADGWAVPQFRRPAGPGREGTGDSRPNEPLKGPHAP